LLRARHALVDVPRRVGAHHARPAVVEQRAVRGAAGNVGLARASQVAGRRGLGARGSRMDAEPAASSPSLAGGARAGEPRDLPDEYHRHRPDQGRDAQVPALGRGQLPAVFPAAHARGNRGSDTDIAARDALFSERRALPQIIMCGIAGWMALPQHAPDDGAMASVLEALAHRGPDGAGACAFQSSKHRVVLGHRRLAIIDPNGARQPMCDEAAGVALTFNGEIYNFRELRTELAQRGYRFALDSDTEVLLRAYQHWELDVVHHLRGQFAFAVWDSRKQRLLLARDRFGEKPLYLCESGGSVFFASEVKALLRMPGIRPEVD